MRRRTVLTGVGCVVALAVAATVTVSVVNGQHGPEQAVRDYVTLIAQGNPEAATATVDPRSVPGDVDPARLAAALHAATARITVDSVGDPARDYDHPDDDATRTVRVEYSVANAHGSATLRVRRAPNRYGVFTRWRVVDPLLVPVAVQNAYRAFGTVHAGAAELPTVADIYGSRPVLLYPGAYLLRGRPSKYLDAKPIPAAVAGLQTDYQPDERSPASFYLDYKPKPALRQLVESAVDGHVDACVAAGRAMDRTCPENLYGRAALGTNLALREHPALASISLGEDKHADGTSTVGYFFQTSPATFSYVEDGRPDTDDFIVNGLATVNRDDTVAVTFQDY